MQELGCVVAQEAYWNDAAPESVPLVQVRERDTELHEALYATDCAE